MLNFYDLMVFLEAAECSNFSETGRNLHLSQPAISQKMENLEKHFGIKLFMRDGRTMRLTDAGKALKPLAQDLINSVRILDETMVSLQGEVIGEMTVGCSTASGKYLLPGIIAAFRKEFPQVRINVQITSRRSVIDRLLTKDFALGVSSKKVPHRDLEYREFFRDDVILIVPSTHRWVGLPQISPRDILSEPIILREETAGTRDVFLTALLEHCISPDMLKVAMVLGNTEAIEMAVEQGIGVAFISRLAASRGLELGYVSEVRVEGLDLTRDIYLVRSRRSPATKAQSEFWDFIHKLDSSVHNGSSKVTVERIANGMAPSKV